MKINKILNIQQPYELKTYKDKIIVKVWDWEYSRFLETLKNINLYISQNPSKQIYLFCSHSACLTNGQGLEKSKGKIKDDLVEFTNDHLLDFPTVFKVKRGGGLTFHHGGQLNFYPIFHLTHQKKNLQTYMLRLLKYCAQSLNDLLETNDFHYKGPFLGLWHHDNKVGSIGMGLERYVTQHGYSLNFFNNPEFITQIKKCYPCGINLENYKSVNELYTIDSRFRQSFIEKFLSKIFE